MVIFSLFHKKGFQFPQISEDFRILTPPGNGLYLRMIRRADDDDLPSSGGGVGHDLMDLLHPDAGGVGDLAASGGQCVIDILPLPVGTDDDPAAGRDILHPVHAPHPLGLQVPDDRLVMDDGSQHHKGPSAVSHLLGQLHRSANPEAKTGRLCQDDLSHDSAASISSR